MQSIDLTEAYSYGTSKDLLNESEVIKYKKMIQEMINFDDHTKKYKIT